ncbi:DNA cytosine methyltransferase [Catenuloplanes sp. NPDC051500]|uniref:DNA cytosine methyltransferase n=1 Tax=Catenuloplanes sp. NPDC051500 TaxID=3363959 RepID=UPI003788AF7C
MLRPNDVDARALATSARAIGIPTDISSEGWLTVQGHQGTVLSLFSGAGGLDLGLEAAGFETKACLEIDPFCADTLKANRPKWRQLECRDVTIAADTIKPKSLDLKVGELDLIAGGPPCQPFSVAAQWANTGRRGMEDDRAQTVVAMLDLVDAFQPRALLIENVAGFLRGEISALPFICDRLAEINAKHGTAYELHAQIIDSADYGVPQRRNRVIGIATRDGKPIDPPAPTHAHAPIRAWDAIGDLREVIDLPPNQGSYAALLPSIPEGKNYQYLTARGGGEELFGYRTRYWSFLLKLAKDLPAWTLAASPGPSTGPFHWDNRPLTARECLRLQSFPDEWKLAGPYRQQIKQAGNATPPLLAEVVGRTLLAVLNNAHEVDEARPKLLRERIRGAIPPPIPPVPVPEQYRSQLGIKKAHPGTGKGPRPREVSSNQP